MDKVIQLGKANEKAMTETAAQHEKRLTELGINGITAVVIPISYAIVYKDEKGEYVSHESVNQQRQQAINKIEQDGASTN